MASSPRWVLEGNVTTDVVVDREGKVRELGSVISENSGIVEAGRRRILAMRFTPFMVNGAPVEAMSQIRVPFKTVRPAGSPLRVPAPILSAAEKSASSLLEALSLSCSTPNLRHRRVAEQ
jgi:hypothetical protein